MIGIFRIVFLAFISVLPSISNAQSSVRNMAYVYTAGNTSLTLWKLWFRLG